MHQVPREIIFYIIAVMFLLYYTTVSVSLHETLVLVIYIYVHIYAYKHLYTYTSYMCLCGMYYDVKCKFLR